MNPCGQERKRSKEGGSPFCSRFSSCQIRKRGDPPCARVKKGNIFSSTRERRYKGLLPSCASYPSFSFFLLSFSFFFSSIFGHVKDRPAIGGDRKLKPRLNRYAHRDTSFFFVLYLSSCTYLCRQPRFHYLLSFLVTDKLETTVKWGKYR